MKTELMFQLMEMREKVYASDAKIIDELKQEKEDLVNTLVELTNNLPKVDKIRIVTFLDPKRVVNTILESGESICMEVDDYYMGSLLYNEEARCAEYAFGEDDREILFDKGSDDSIELTFYSSDEQKFKVIFECIDIQTIGLRSYNEV